jgi:aerobic carbon-monoxide dehydrogenase small subunit
MQIALRVNGAEVVRDVDPQELLLDLLRDGLDLTGAKRSCDVQVCGACTVLVDGLPVSSCCFLAADAHGKDVTTIEGLADTPEFDRLEAAFTQHAGLQCGFCTPGMLLTVHALLESGELDSEEEIKRSLSGNLCRCTGYRGILEAVGEVAAAR